MSFFKKLIELNTTRQKEWDPDSKFDLLFRALEHVSEAGELGNKVKKYWRAMQVDIGSKTSIKEIEDEVGDVIVTLSLLCSDLGIDIEKATINKFNATSEKYNLVTKWEDTFFTRLLKEQEELKTKLNGLSLFIDKGKPESFTDKAWDLLVQQELAMTTYNAILKERIADIQGS
jgi:NTP pyrophosphatase (non-canonical NTP hydrolase)